MADGYVLDEELVRLVQQTVKQFGNSFQPRPKRGRRPRRVGGGSSPVESGPSTFARVYTNIEGATGPAVVQYGTGEAQIINGDGSLNDPIEVQNPWPIYFPTDAMVELSGNLVRTGTCGPAPWTWG